MRKFLLILLVGVSLFSCSEENSPNVGNEEVSEFSPDIKVEKPFKEKRVIISEVSVRNRSVADFNGDYSDWIEIYNQSNAEVDLSKIYFSDDGTKTKWELPNYALQPHSYFTVFASGKNIKEFKPNRDSTTLKVNGIWTWADDNNEDDLSYINPYQFAKYDGEINGEYAISAEFYISDNSSLKNGSNWSDNTFNLTFDKSMSSVDFTKFSRFFFKGYIEKDKPIRVVFTQDGVNEWEGYQVIIIGRGGDSDEYEIPLVNVPILDLSKLKSIQLRSKSGYFKPVKATLYGFGFYTIGNHSHTNFSLSSNEKVTLYNSKEDYEDVVKLSDTFTDGSIARNLENGEWSNSSLSTFEEDNVAGDKFYTPPVHYPTSGFYNGEVEVKVFSHSEEVYYTLDGSEPTINASKYSSPVKISKTTVFKSRVIDEEGSSLAQTSTYFVDEPTKLPVFSISANPGSFFDNDTGIYVLGDDASPEIPYLGANFWDDKEIPVNIEFFEDDKTIQFNEKVGCKIFGNYSRSLDKKALSFTFSKEYGKGSIKQKFFKYSHPQLENFNNFILRANGNHESRTTFRDGLLTTFADKLGVDVQKFRPVVVFINGEYWGIHAIREKLNEHYFYTNYGYDINLVTIYKDWGVVQYGDGGDWQDVSNYIYDEDLNKEENYKHVSSRFDIDNYIDYQMFEMYIVNKDWPANNHKWYMMENPQSKWKQMIYDTDAAFGGWDERDYKTNTFEYCTNDDSKSPDWPNGPNYTKLFRSFLESDEFKRRFINRSSVILSSYISPEIFNDSIASFKARVADEIERDYKRWDLKYLDFDEEVDLLVNFSNNRYDVFIQDMEAFFGIEDKKCEVEISVQGSGSIIIEGKLVKEFPAKFRFYKGYPVEFEIPKESLGSFSGWSDGVAESKRVIDFAEDQTLTVQF